MTQARYHPKPVEVLARTSNILGVHFDMLQMAHSSSDSHSGRIFLKLSSNRV
jgi:hypothetical protein